MGINLSNQLVKDLSTYKKSTHCALYSSAEEKITQQYTYEEINIISQTLSKKFNSFKNCKTIAIHLPNEPLWICYFIAAVFSGKVVIIFDSANDLLQIKNQITQSAPDILITSNDSLKKLTHELSSINGDKEWIPRTYIADNNDLNYQLYKNNIDNSVYQANEDDIVLIMYTSGSTGNPRGVTFTHKAICAAINSPTSRLQHIRNAKLLALVPFSHIYGLISSLLTPMSQGCTVVCIDSMKPTVIRQVLVSEKIEGFCATPVIFESIYKNITSTINSMPPIKQKISHTLLSFSEWLHTKSPVIGKSISRVLFSSARNKLGKKLRFLVSGGSRLQPQAAIGLSSLGFYIQEGYGLTETTSCICLSDYTNLVPGSVGKPLANVSVKIHNPDESGQGELWIMSDQLMSGYHNNPQLTQDTLESNWLKTGDIARIDENGNIFITGRIKNIIITSAGKNIYPEDIESHFAFIPYVKEVLVIGETNDSQTKIAGIFVCEEIHADKITEINNSISEHNNKLPTHARVQKVYITTNALPKLRNQKIDRRLIIKDLDKYISR